MSLGYHDMMQVTLTRSGHVDAELGSVFSLYFPLEDEA